MRCSRCGGEMKFFGKDSAKTVYFCSLCKFYGSELIKNPLDDEIYVEIVIRFKGKKWAISRFVSHELKNVWKDYRIRLWGLIIELMGKDCWTVVERMLDEPEDLLEEYKKEHEINGLPPHH